MQRNFQPADFAPSGARRAVTLIELLLVLGILVAVAAIAAPALSGSVEAQRLKSAARQVQAIWTRAHVKAMRTGQPQVFHCELGSDKYEIIPWTADVTADDPRSQGNTGSFSAPQKTPASVADEDAPRLPEGIQFLMSDTQAEERSAAIESVMAQNSSRQAQWSRPVLFFPDGATSDAYLLMQNKREKAIRLDLRGMTGSVVVSEISTVQELSQ